MKIALCLSGDASRAARVAGAMARAQVHEPGCATRRIDFPLGTLCLVGRPDEPVDDWLLWEGADGSFLAVAGLPIDSATGRGGRSVLSAGMAGVLSGGDGDAVRALLGRLDGAFVALWWCARERELTVVTDFLGMQPLYRAELDGATLIASEVKALARSGDLAVEPDAGAWGAMLYFGHQVGPRTLLAGVTRLPPARELVFDASRHGVARETSTWEWPASAGRSDSTALRDAIGDAVRADVAAYAAAHPGASLLLSGGFDSRLILCLCRDIGLSPRLLIQSHPDENADADARFARAFARALGMSATTFPARAGFYGGADYLRFLALNEIATPSLYLFIPNVLPVVRGERDGVWEGLLLDPALKFDYGAGGFASYIESRTGGRRRGYARAVRRVFSPAWADRIDAGYDALLAAERGEYPDDEEGVWRFSVLNRSRFRTGVNPYLVYDSHTPALTPGMSRRFWEVVSSADPRLRFGKRLYRSVFERLAPDGLRVPIASGSELVRGRGGNVTYAAQRVRAAVQATAQRPRVTRALRAAGLPTPFAWEPSPFPEVALGEAALDDPMLNADGIRALRSGGPRSHADGVALEVLMYWRAWHLLMRGELLTAWSPPGSDLARVAVDGVGPTLSEVTS